MKVQNINNGAFPLRLAGEGERVKIVSLKGGRSFRDRLVSMGLNVGSEVEIIQAGEGGKMLIGCKGSRLFLGGGMSQKIDVAIIQGGAG